MKYYNINIGKRNVYEFEYNEKSACKHGMECEAFIRLESGGNRLDDRCHIKLYPHPPRTDRQIRMTEDVAKVIINTHHEQNRDICAQYIGHNSALGALLSEVIVNGYKNDLFLSNTTEEEYKNDQYTIMKIGDQKMNHPRHKALGSPLTRAQMLALILYTGCGCNYDLCKSHRSGDYEKWKWFDACLYKAIEALNDKETGSYKLYTGLSNVKLPVQKLKRCYFPTYVSTRWVKDVAITFINDGGMIIEIDENSMRQLNCCDVSWISKFSDECEILVARSIFHKTCSRFYNNPSIFPGHVTEKCSNSFNLSIQDEKNGIQILTLQGGICVEGSWFTNTCLKYV